MANFNRVILLGNLTRDPELSYTPSNTPICKFGMAINRTWRDQQGERREETCFVDCTAFGRTAETINQYVSKGRPLMIEGRLQYSQWTSQEGQKRSKLAVIAETFQFVDSRGSSEGDGGQPQARQQRDYLAPPAGPANTGPPAGPPAEPPAANNAPMSTPSEYGSPAPAPQSPPPQNDYDPLSSAEVDGNIPF